MKITKSNQEKRKNSKKLLKKIKKEVKGITLIALVVTIIVLLILAGVAISLTVGDNGLFRRAQNAADTWQMAEQNEQSEMDKAADFIDDYANNITRVDGVPIPNGFYYVGGAKDTGLIISDRPEDESKYSEANWSDQENIPNGVNAETGINGSIAPIEGNQFVWVSVEHPENYFTNETVTLNINATSTGPENEVTTNVYSKFKLRSEDQSSYTEGTPGVEKTEGGDPVIREPDVLSFFDTDAQYYLDILDFDSTKAMAESFVSEYKAMSNSIKKYKGFYIGRYELTGTLEAPTEKSGDPLTNQNWYNVYKASQKVVTGNSNVKSTMIYGVQWDATMEWLKATKFKDDPSKVDTDSSSWGNYNNSSGNAAVGAGSPQVTGYSEYWKANNIYDLAGNCLEYTQEAASISSRGRRGGNYNCSSLEGPASDRVTYNPTSTGSVISSRVTLYIMS